MKQLPNELLKQITGNVDIYQINGGQQVAQFYPNGFGVSIVYHDFSYGLELAVLKGTQGNSKICYETEITGDVLSYLSVEEALETIKRIKELDYLT